MLLSWFDVSEEKKFGVFLAEFYMERNNPSIRSKSEKFEARKQEELLGKMAQQIAKFKVEHKLNIYKKAQVGNSFKWTMRESGCDPEYVNQLTGWLMHRL